jgi:putative N6-adenine-specific DNA methylase
VHVEKREARDWASGAGPEFSLPAALTGASSRAEGENPGPLGLVVVNPPYGERLGETEELRPVYRGLGDLFKKKFPGWEAYVLTGSPELAKEVGLSASRRFVLMNGPIECRLLKYEIFAGSRG